MGFWGTGWEFLEGLSHSGLLASTHQVLALFLIPGHPMGGGKVPQSVSSSVSIALFMSGSEVRTGWLVGGREPLMS